MTADVTRAIVAVPLDGSAASDPHAGARHRVGQPVPRVSDPFTGRREARVDCLEPPGHALGLDPTARRRVGRRRRCLRGTSCSVQTRVSPCLSRLWADASTLYAISDRSGWWNLYRVDAAGGVEPTPVAPRDEEFSGPLWQLGYRRCAMLDDGKHAVVHGGAGAEARHPRPDDRNDHRRRLALHGVATADRGQRPVLWSASPAVRYCPTPSCASTSRPASTSSCAGPPTSCPTRRSCRGLTPRRSRVRAGATSTRMCTHLATRSARGSGRRAAAVHRVRARRADGDSSPSLRLEYAYFTSRGIGVVDVDYGGSTGYGREYRERLRGQWGIVDVEDCAAAALAFGEERRGRRRPAGHSRWQRRRLDDIGGTDPDERLRRGHVVLRRG